VSKKAQQAASFQSDESAMPSLEVLAAQQGVVSVDDFDTLLGKPAPDDESLEEFSAMLREWRREGTVTDAER